MRIETAAVLGLVRPVDAIAIELPGHGLVAIHVPDVFGALRQGNALQLAPALAVEQAQLDLFGISREQREIHAAAVPCRTERMRSPTRSPHATAPARGAAWPAAAASG